MKPHLFSRGAAAFSLLVAGVAAAQTAGEPPAGYSPYVEANPRHRDFAEGLYWGDTHLHTRSSTDAGMVGTRLGPEDAYRFARGDEVTTSTGQRARLSEPLDFLVVADHAENLGLASMIEEANPDLLATEWGRKLHGMVRAGQGYEAFRLWGMNSVMQNKDLIASPAMSRTAWDRQVAAAENYDEPGRFTALIGFEWSSINNMAHPGNLHRVVIFRDGGERARQVLPFSTFDSPDPEKLWDYLAAYERSTGGRALAIPHNGNLSNGLMFAVERLGSRPFDRRYAETRARWEPLYEVTQIMGDGEAHPTLSPEDEFADYGTWDKSDIAGFQPKTEAMLPHEYARTALQLGLQQQVLLGTNPFKFGLVGGTDSHTAMATTREENFWGKYALTEPSAGRYEQYAIQSIRGDESLSTFSWEQISAGLAAVWARENTREALFDAMLEKETYATTGTRVTVRFFGGWDYERDDVFRPDAVEIGYRRGVPMGGDLPARDGGGAPVFMVTALKDARSGHLDRIQIVKGWADAEGERRERIHDVAVSDGRAIGADGRCRTPVGNTVDAGDATWLNTIGDPELRAVWTDPSFDPAQPAVYYARVLEIPTPTWQAYDAKHFGLELPPEVPVSHQERAYTSPIWYTP